MCVADLIDEEFWGYGTEHTWLYGIFKRDTYLKNREYAWDTIFYQPSYNEFMSFMRGEDNDIRDIVNEATEIVMPESVRTIYESTFELCGELRCVVFPDSLRTIGLEAFVDCDRLYRFEGKPIEQIKIESGAFDNCMDLADENGFIIINDILFCSPARYMYEELSVPDGVTETSFRAFWSEADEYDMRLPGAVRNGCRIVNLPPSVKTIRLDSFGENTKIVNIASSTNVIGCVEDNTKIKINRY